MAQIELTVPDLGGFNDIPVIEVLVAPGETVAKDAPLVTLESDKATMEVPASAGGVVKELRVKIGDKVSQGTVLATLESAEPQPEPASAPAGCCRSVTTERTQRMPTAMKPHSPRGFKLGVVLGPRECARRRRLRATA